MINALVMPTQQNLSIAWARAFLELMKPGAGVRHPSVITIQGFDTDIGVEDSQIRTRLDQTLKQHGKNSCATVAGTIFPSSMWNSKLQNNADILFKRYNQAWPGIKMCPQNRKGVYFRRLTSFQSKTASGDPVNQLKVIIDTYQGGNHRKSALQASIFDPSRDHSNARISGFPCLQQVAFTPLGENELSVTGFYAKQLHVEKAYGNYLGLYDLGRFMAKQMGLKLTQVICIASCLELSEFKKHDLHGLETDLKNLLQENK